VRPRTAFVSALSLIFVTGCNLLNGRCTYELRSLEVSGSVDNAGGQPASAQLALSEQRGSLQGQSIHWLVTADALKGHVLSATFKDNADLSKVLLDLTVANADRPEISQGATSTSSGANLAGFHDILDAGRGVVELQTDLGAQPTIRIPVDATSSSGWVRPFCS